MNILNKIKAIIFDMDGVIVDSEALHFEAESATCREFGINAPQEAWKEFTGCKADYFFGALNERYGTRPIDLSEVISANMRKYIELAEEKLQLIDGVLNFLHFTAQRFEKVGLATSGNKLSQELVFRKFALDKYFDHIITGRDLEKSKPHPEPYLRSTAGLGMDPEDCLVIEDAVNGILSAKAAGCRSVGLTTSFPPKVLLDAGADFVVSSYTQLRNQINLCQK
jgi:HAD superfamily hydrolase (TIGR01509 family)